MKIDKLTGRKLVNRDKAIAETNELIKTIDQILEFRNSDFVINNSKEFQRLFEQQCQDLLETHKGLIALRNKLAESDKKYI